MEIERKFLLRTLPQLPVMDIRYIEQGYLSTEPEVRIRSKFPYGGSRTHTLCIKSNGMLSREEIETTLTPTKFETLVPMCGAPLLRKVYLKYQWNDYTLECSVVDPGAPHSFIYAEIEFATEEEAQAFEPPSFFGKEVTDDPAYKMKNVWEQLKKGGLRMDAKESLLVAAELSALAQEGPYGTNPPAVAARVQPSKRKHATAEKKAKRKTTQASQRKNR